MAGVPWGGVRVEPGVGAGSGVTVDHRAIPEPGVPCGGAGVVGVVVSITGRGAECQAEGEDVTYGFFEDSLVVQHVGLAERAGP